MQTSTRRKIAAAIDRNTRIFGVDVEVPHDLVLYKNFTQLKKLVREHMVGLNDVRITAIKLGHSKIGGSVTLKVTYDVTPLLKAHGVDGLVDE